MSPRSPPLPSCSASQLALDPPMSSPAPPRVHHLLPTEVGGYRITRRASAALAGRWCGLHLPRGGEYRSNHRRSRRRRGRRRRGRVCDGPGKSMQLDFVNFRGTGSVRDAVPSEHSVYQVDNIRKTGPNDETIREWAVECASYQEIIEIFGGKIRAILRAERPWLTNSTESRAPKRPAQQAFLSLRKLT